MPALLPKVKLPSVPFRNEDGGGRDTASTQQVRRTVGPVGRVTAGEQDGNEAHSSRLCPGSYPLSYQATPVGVAEVAST